MEPKEASHLFSGRLISPHDRLDSESDFAQEIRRVEDHLRKLILRKNVLYAPISVLPDEILAKIFHFVQLEPRPPFNVYGWFRPRHVAGMHADPRCLLPVLLVSRQWRDIAMNEPSLWATIGSAWWSSTGAHTLMDRSKNAHLSCAINERSIPPPIWGSPGAPWARRYLERKPWSIDELKCLLSHSFRIYHIDLALALTNYAAFEEDETLRDSWAILVDASFAVDSNHYPGSDVSKVPEIPIVRAERLRFLTVQGFTLGPQPNTYLFPALEEFCMRSSGSQVTSTSLSGILSFLSRTPQLRYLELEAYTYEGGSDAHSLPTPIELPHLKEIILIGPRGEDSTLLSIAKQLSFSLGCSLSYYIAPPSVYVPPPLLSDGNAPDLHETLSRAIPFPPDAIRPHHIQLSAPQSGRPEGVCMSADIDTPEDENEARSPAPLHRLHVESSTVLDYPSPDLWPHPPGATSDSFERHSRVWKRARSEDVETLTRTCALSSLRTLTCSVIILSDVWVRILSGCTELRDVRLTGLSAAREFGEALSLGASEHGFLPALTHVELAPAQPISYGWGNYPGWAGSPLPTPEEEFPWHAILRLFTDALANRSRAAGGKLTRITVDRPYVGCGSHANLLEEAGAVVELGTVVEELVFL